LSAERASGLSKGPWLRPAPCPPPAPEAPTGATIARPQGLCARKHGKTRGIHTPVCIGTMTATVCQAAPKPGPSPDGRLAAQRHRPTPTSTAPMTSTASADTRPEAATQPVRFFHRGQVVEVLDAHPTRSVLDWLREDA